MGSIKTLAVLASLKVLAIPTVSRLADVFLASRLGTLTLHTFPDDVGHPLRRPVDWETYWINHWTAHRPQHGRSRQRIMTILQIARELK